MDTCFSILQFQFEDRSPHTFDVELLAYAYARYLRLMQRWRAVESELAPLKRALESGGV